MKSKINNKNIDNNNVNNVQLLQIKISDSLSKGSALNIKRTIFTIVK